MVLELAEGGDPPIKQQAGALRENLFEKIKQFMENKFATLEKRIVFLDNKINTVLKHENDLKEDLNLETQIKEQNLQNDQEDEKEDLENMQLEFKKEEIIIIQLQKQERQEYSNERNNSSALLKVWNGVVKEEGKGMKWRKDLASLFTEWNKERWQSSWNSAGFVLEKRNLDLNGTTKLSIIDFLFLEDYVKDWEIRMENKYRFKKFLWGFG